jgi:outer membrane protease
MKNITSLIVLVTIISAFFAVNNAYSDTGGRYKFSIGPKVGFVHGQALELVYPLPGQTKAELLSELKWDMKPVFYLGLNMEFGRADIMSRLGFFSSISFKAGLPGDSGRLENRDWQNPLNDSLTDFSSHTNRTQEFFWLDTSIGISIPIRPYFFIKPFLSGSWMRFAFSGRDGYGIYDWYNDSEISFEGQEVIRYRQDWFLAAAGLTFGARFASNFQIAFSFQISPFTYCNARDDHLSVQIQNIQTPHRIYLDSTYRGLFMEPGVSLTYLMRRTELSLDFSYRHIGRTVGETHMSVNNTSFELDNKAGAGLKLINLSLLAKIRL